MPVNYSPPINTKDNKFPLNTKECYKLNMAYEFTQNPGTMPCFVTLKKEFNELCIVVIQETAETITTEPIDNFDPQKFPEWIIREF